MTSRLPRECTFSLTVVLSPEAMAVLDAVDTALDGQTDLLDGKQFEELLHAVAQQAVGRLVPPSLTLPAPVQEALDRAAAVTGPRRTGLLLAVAVMAVERAALAPLPG